MKNSSLQLTCFIIASVIGAGFASGKEIATFFAQFGYFSIWLAIICGVLFYVLCKLFLMASFSIKTNHFGDVSKVVFKKYAPSINKLLFICFIISIGSMTAGANAIGRVMVTGYTGYSFAIITLMLGSLVAIGSFKAIHKINYILVPLMVVFIIVTCVLSYIYIDPTKDMILKPLHVGDYFMGIGSSLLYVCLNMLSTGLLLMQIGTEYTKKQINRASFWCASLITTIVILMCLAIINSNFTIFESEMPLLALAVNMNVTWSIIISVIVWFAIFTSIISTILVVATYVKQFVKNYVLSVIIVALLALTISFIGFENIVTYIYPIMGVLGLILILLIFKQISPNANIQFFTKKKHKNSKQIILY